MLDSMRALSKGLISKLLMAFLVISFAVWGVGDILRGGGASYAAKIDGKIITVADLSRQAALLQSQLEEVGMKNVAKAQIQLSALRQLVQQRLNLLAMHDLGLYASDALVVDSIAAMPQLKDKATGKFSRANYEAFLKGNRLSEKAFVGEMKNEITTKFLGDSLAMSDLQAPESVLKLESVVNSESRDAVLFTIPARDAMDEKNTAALQKYYDENKEMLYMNPERRTFDYVVLTKADLEALVDHAITDAMVEDLIQTKPELNKQLARIKLRDEQRDSTIRSVNNTIEDELAAGRTLTAALAKAGVKTNLRTLSGISADVAKISTEPITRTVAEQGFGMGTGEVSNLIATKAGDTLIVSVKSITPASPKPFEEVKADIKTRLAKQLAREAAQAKAVGVKEALANAPNWQAVADEQKLAARVVSRLARPVEGKASGGDVPPALLQAIFEREVGQVAGPLALPDGSQMLALVTASHLPPVSEDKPSLSPQQLQMLNDRLARDIENRAYQSFAAKHKVKINAAVMQSTQPSAGGEE